MAMEFIVDKNTGSIDDVDIDVDVVKIRAQANASMPASYNSNIQLSIIYNYRLSNQHLKH